MTKHYGSLQDARLLSALLVAVIVASGLYTTPLASAATAPIVKAPGDDDAPKIRWLDQIIVEGKNRFTIALKDESTIITKTITYTKFDPIFEEYDKVTVALTASTAPNIYYADIDVMYPQTVIRVDVADAWENDDTETQKFQISPPSLNVNVDVADSTVASGSPLSLVLTNNHQFEVSLEGTVKINGASQDTLYDSTFKSEVSGLGKVKVDVPVTIAKHDTNKHLSVVVTLKAFGLSSDHTIDVVFEGSRVPQQSNELKGRYERVPFSGTFKIESDVAKMSLIVPEGVVVTTPSGHNLKQEAESVPRGAWTDRILITSDDTPIEIKVFRFNAGDRALFVIDVPEVGQYQSTGNGVALLRHYP